MWCCVCPSYGEIGIRWNYVNKCWCWCWMTCVRISLLGQSTTAAETNSIYIFWDFDHFLLHFFLTFFLLDIFSWIKHNQNQYKWPYLIFRTVGCLFQVLLFEQFRKKGEYIVIIYMLSFCVISFCTAAAMGKYKLLS